MKSFITSILILFISVSYAQKNNLSIIFKINVYSKDTSGFKALSKALIKIKEVNSKHYIDSAETNKKGYIKQAFSFDQNLKYHIEISKTGYETRLILFNPNKHGWFTPFGKDRLSFWTSLNKGENLGKDIKPFATIKYTSNNVFDMTINDSLNSKKTTDSTNAVHFKNYSGVIVINDKRFTNELIGIYTRENQLINKTKTDLFGNFSIIVPDSLDNFSLKNLNKINTPVGSSVKIINITGTKVFETKVGANGFFEFKILPADMVKLEMLAVPDDQLSAKIKGKISSDSTNKTPVANADVYLLNKGQKVDETKTNSNGEFEFLKVSKEGEFDLSFKLANENNGVKSIYLFAENGNAVSKINKGPNGDFNYKVLETDKVYLQTLYYEDPWLDLKGKSKTINEAIHFASNSADLNDEAKIILEKILIVLSNDKSIKLQINAHTDSKGDSETNMALSEKRASAVKKYLEDKGIEGTRLTSQGFGETKLLNKCADNVECSEEEHAVNRRIEFIVK